VQNERKPEPAPVKPEKKSKKDKKSKSPDGLIADVKAPPVKAVFHPISYILELQFTNSVCRQELLALKFVTEDERARWLTHLSFLKERRQMKLLLEKFGGLQAKQAKYEPVTYHDQRKNRPPALGQGLKELGVDANKVKNPLD